MLKILLDFELYVSTDSLELQYQCGRILLECVNKLGIVTNFENSQQFKNPYQKCYGLNLQN